MISYKIKTGALLSALGIEFDEYVRLTVGQNEIVVGQEGTTTTHKVSVKFDTVKSVIDGNASTLVCATLKKKLVEAIDYVASFHGHKAAADPLGLGGVDVSAKKPAVVMVATSEPEKNWVPYHTKAVKKSVTGTKHGTITDTALKVEEGVVKTGPKVKAADAAHLYQAVAGTSEDSVYHVVGMADGLVVAARYLGNKVSIRVEGAALEDGLPKLVDVGFTLNQNHLNKGYCSMHVQVDNKVMANKVIGGLVAALCTGIHTAVPHVEDFASHGA